ncbi:Holliday junction branch migration protein RuvA [Clostridium rectalis]|uniref:Holliday junction branch migration protein RuvA n=1 Tax=Clostridium rectalis TaxID=2040295 RepID=UPI000F63EDB4|nr:Holliday junction branch migration protein RuvA [Clostridium rectalis]
MYEYIIGVFKGIRKDYIIVENSDIAYKIYTSGSTITNIPKMDEKIKLYIQQIVRDDFNGLYGFMTVEEREMFNLLLTISGVGAKAALSLLSISNVSNLKYAILTSDEKTLTRAPGIGKKTAQRIILELKDKLDSGDILENFSKNGQESIIKDNTVEVLAALISLGYTEKEGKKALKSVDKNENVENIIKECLKNLMN